MKRNNRGVTLVEVICTIGLLSIVGLAAMSMMVVVARMNHKVMLQEQQARQAEVVIETLKYQLLRHPSTYDENTITVAATNDQQGRSIVFCVEPQEDGEYALVMNVEVEGDAQGTASTLATDLTENGFSIEQVKIGEDGNQTPLNAYRLTLNYASGNSFEWIITPRLTQTRSSGS